MGSVTGLWAAAALFYCCGLWGLVGGSQGFWDDPSYLQCGPTEMQFSLPFLIRDSAFVLTAIDDQGKSHYLHNNSACGTWVGQTSDGSVVIGAAYDGCYVSIKDESYVMTISLEEVTNGLVQYNKKDLTCHMLPAMDAPAPSECSSIVPGYRLPCGTAPVTQDTCQRLGCCFEPTDAKIPCFFGNKLTAQCTDANNFVVAVSKDLTRPSLNLDSVRLLGVDSTSCPALSVEKSDPLVLFQFPLSCGGMNQGSDGSIIYENTFEATRDIRTWKGASITRDTTMRVTVQCSYSRTAVLPLQIQVFTLAPPPPVSTTGPISLEMRIAKDMQYSSYYVDGDYPLTKVLRDPVYLEVRLLQRTDPNLVLILNNCWANPSVDERNQPQWPMLLNRCPFPGDNYITRLIPLGVRTQAVPFPSHYQRFVMSTFTFVDGTTQSALGGLVYFHCSASVCVPSALDSCSTTCTQRKKRESLIEFDTRTSIVTSDGPVNFIRPEEGKPIPLEGVVRPESSALPWLRGVAAVGGMLAVTLTVFGLWRRRRNQSPAMHAVKV
ncbi:zona pellucida sperm-binding protein 4-like [Pelodytes ibericus]